MEHGELGEAVRNGVIVGLHGAGPEKLRDAAVQLLALMLQSPFGGRWALGKALHGGGGGGHGGGGGGGEGEGLEHQLPDGADGGVACLFIRITCTELRLLVDEALALHTPEKDAAAASESTGAKPAATAEAAAKAKANRQAWATAYSAKAGAPESPGLDDWISPASAEEVELADPGPKLEMSEAVHAARSRRVLQMVPMCLRVVEAIIELLCDGLDALELEEAEAEGNHAGANAGANAGASAGAGLGAGAGAGAGALTHWGQLPGTALVQIQEAIHGVMSTIVEFLQDLQRSHRALKQPVGGELTELVTEVARCLGCWLAQEPETMQKELTEANTLPFLLEFSEYYNGPSGDGAVVGGVGAGAGAGTGASTGASTGTGTGAGTGTGTWADDGEPWDSDDEGGGGGRAEGEGAGRCDPHEANVGASVDANVASPVSEKGAGLEMWDSLPGPPDLLHSLLPALVALADDELRFVVIRPLPTASHCCLSPPAATCRHLPPPATACRRLPPPPPLTSSGCTPVHRITI